VCEHGEKVKVFVRMDAPALLRSGRTAAQRDLYYRVGVGPDGCMHLGSVREAQ
jgi:hypothetical protein